MYTEDQFGWIDSPVQQYSTFRINMLFELVLFSIILFFLNPKLYVSNRLHDLWYETNYIVLITLLVIIFQIAPLTSQYSFSRTSTSVIR